MKILFTILVILYIPLLIVTGGLILKDKSSGWALETSNTALAKCNQAILNCRQDIQNELDEEAQQLYQENLEPINIFSEEELSEQEALFIDYLYDVPEDVYVEPPEKVCIRWDHFMSQDICQEWAWPL